ncbi:hypothetical protein D1871_10545 [Nakamurella silvestris]|nr:hypothetical protein D1871_10545 [Nakamurella silvestris]
MISVVSGLLCGVVISNGVAGASSAEKDDEIVRTSWQMYISDQPHGEMKSGFVGTEHGDVKYFEDADVPDLDDPKWQAAPDPDVIGFDGRTDPKFGGDKASRLPAGSCFKQVDYTYFQTFVTVPKGTTVDKFEVTFDHIDDGARIEIYNVEHPEGVIDANSHVKLNKSVTVDLHELISTGVNRVVVTQLDDCPTGNNLGRASISLNGTAVGLATDPNPESAIEDLKKNPGTKKSIVTSTWGDVHISTPDGLVYDFQTTGDLILVNGGPGVQVQARQETWESNPKVTINTAAALQVGADTLEFYQRPELSFYLNGVLTPLPTDDVRLPGGGKIESTEYGLRTSKDLTIEWPDGENFGRVVLFRDHIDIGFLRGGDSRTYEGVLGDQDGDPRNDLQVRGGALITPPATWEELNTFSDSWRVSGEESLFKGGAPAKAVSAPESRLTLDGLDPDSRAEAANTCEAAGLTDQLALDNCTFDVAATGDDIFVDSALAYAAAVAELPAEAPAIVGGLEAAPAETPSSGTDPTTSGEPSTSADPTTTESAATDPANAGSEPSTSAAETSPAADPATAEDPSSKGLFSNPLVWVGLGLLLLLILVLIIVAGRRRKDHEQA